MADERSSSGGKEFDLRTSVACQFRHHGCARRGLRGRLARPARFGPARARRWRWRQHGAAECDDPRSRPGVIVPPPPSGTYRLQFHAGFTFEDARRLLPYLHGLGISHVYASPYLRARSGSMHGYDVADPNSLNPELGSQAEYDNLVATLQHHRIDQL